MEAEPKGQAARLNVKQENLQANHNNGEQLQKAQQTMEMEATLTLYEHRFTLNHISGYLSPFLVSFLYTIIYIFLPTDILKWNYVLNYSLLN